MLTIEIKGIGFNNKGAELMLEAIIDHFKNLGTEIRFVVEPPVSRTQLKRFNLNLKARYLRKGYNTLRILNIFPKFILHKLSIVKSSEIDVVLDASGYGYGDAWAPGIIKNKLSLEIKELANRNIPLVFLSQAFGPFEKCTVVDAFLPAYQNAELICARDDRSLEYLRMLGATKAEIIQAPDYTNLVEPTPYKEFCLSAKTVCLIPNLKMLLHTQQSSNYLLFCRDVLKQTHREGFNPFILIHEKAEDTKLAYKILEGLEQLQIRIVSPDTARQCKWVIGQSSMVISSRFHGLVSALSQGIPSFSTSWNHKYEALLTDYSCQDYLIDLNNAATEVNRVVATLKNAKKMCEIRDHLEMRAMEQKELTNTMWQRVDRLLIHTNS